MASSEVSPQWPAFPARLMSLPAVNDACDLAVHLYQRSKEYKMVGVALGMAEDSVKTAATVAAPLATPLFRYVEHLKPLDEWACRRLDDVERLVPAVTKPTGEMLSATREGVLVTVAGGDDPQPSSLTAAVCSRAARLVEQAEAIKERSVAAGSAPHRLLDAAHHMLDQYLPEERRDLQEPDVREVGVGVKTVSLATKTTRRLCQAAHDRLHAACPLEPTPSHLAIECVQLVRYRWLGRPGGEVQQRQMVVSVLVLALKLAGAVLNLLMAVVMLLVRQVHFARMKMKCHGQCATPLTEDHKPHTN